MKVPYFDLNRQYANIKPEMENRVIRVLRSTQYSLGKEVELFEKNFSSFLNAKYCTGVNTGTSALHLALLALGVGPGDEVITVSMTFIATVMSISYTGAKPVFVDIDRNTQLINSKHIVEKISKKTKAIVVVHLYGQCAEMNEINKIAKKYKLRLIEDSSQAHGAKYYDKYAGTMSDIGTFSFYPGKNLGAIGEGGAIITNNKKLDRKVKELRNWSQPKRYFHNEISYNYRMDSLQAAALNVKLKFLKEWTNKRRKIASEYKSRIKNDKLELTHEKMYNYHVYHIFSLFYKDRSSLQKHLTSNGVGINYHYPVPAHLQKPYFYLGYKKGDMPITESVSNCQLSIPIFPEMKKTEIDYVIKIINKF
jgi:dTDP-4-amino-4,6-dideoxygalactose transaminase